MKWMLLFGRSAPEDVPGGLERCWWAGLYMAGVAMNKEDLMYTSMYSEKACHALSKESDEVSIPSLRQSY